MAAEKSGKTLFIRNLSYKSTNSDLEGAFEEYGPIKSCFVVKDTDEKSRGLGYVTFSVREDAEKAQKSVKTINNRKVFIHFANPKKKKTKKKSDVELDDLSEKNVAIELSDGQGEVPSKKPLINKEQSKEQHVAATTVVITGLGENTTSETVKSLTKACKNVAAVIFPVPERSIPTAFVRCRSKKDAFKATKKINNSHTEALPVKAVLLYQEGRTPKKVSSKKCKLIIRNLSFKCTEEELKRNFHQFGDVTEVKIPTKPDGKKFGYGFVQFSSLEEASRALKEMNTKNILGRPVAVDWALARDKYKEAIQKEERLSDGSKCSEEDDSVSENSDDENSEEDSSEEDEDNEDEDTDESNSSDSDSDDDESLDDSHSEDEGEKKKKKLQQRPSDVGEGKTLFIRNVSFDTEEEDLEELLSQFGDVKYCRIVIDPETEHSKGVAFVQFVDKSDADKCLQASEDEQVQPGGLVLEGRRLKLSLAMSRDDAKKLKKKDQTDDKKDKRNLWLLREGLIRPGTQAAQGLTKVDLQRREQVERIKRQKLKNPDVFVSPTRLCIRNIPTTVKDKELRKVFMKAAQDKSAHVKEMDDCWIGIQLSGRGEETAWVVQSRIMRDLNRVNARGVGKSRGYGFVEFAEHKHALAALRFTNNNPEVFGEKKRLIVEFSLENRAALRTKQQRLERAQAKLEMLKRNAGGAATGKRASARGGKIKVSVVQPPPEGSDGKKIPRGMPSHMGPKVRHKPRQPQQTAKKPKDKLTRKQAWEKKAKRVAESSVAELQPKAKKRKRGKETKDEIDTLVSKYRQTFSKAALKKTATKWFES